MDEVDTVQQPQKDQRAAESDAAIALAQMHDAVPVHKFVPKYSLNVWQCGLTKGRKPQNGVLRAFSNVHIFFLQLVAICLNVFDIYQLWSRQDICTDEGVNLEGEYENFDVEQQQQEDLDLELPSSPTAVPHNQTL